MSKKYVLQRNIDRWLKAHGFYRGKVVKRIASIILSINSQAIIDLSVTNRCMNVFTKQYLYKIQLYGDNMDRDLYNRNLFLSYAKSFVSPIKIYKKSPLTIVMPILDKPVKYDEAAFYVLSELAKLGNKVKFNVGDYPLLKVGINVLGKCECGKLASEKIYKYLKKQEGIQLRVGLVHGDFHRGNIMYMNGKPILIDFDCVRENDIQAIDALYFVLEELSNEHRHNQIWLEYWIYIYRNIESIESHICLQHVDLDLKFGWILLLLERLAQDSQYDSSFVFSNRDVISAINKIFLREK